MVALQPLAVDEEGGRRIHLEDLIAPRPGIHDLFEQVLVGEAFVELVLGHAGLARDQQELVLAVGAGNRPGCLGREQGVDHREVAVVSGAARQHEGGDREIIEGELAQDIAGLSGVDIFGFDLRQDRRLEQGAVRAGHRGVFHDGIGRIRRPHHHLRERAGGHQVGNARVDLVLVRHSLGVLVESAAGVVHAPGHGRRDHHADQNQHGFAAPGLCRPYRLFAAHAFCAFFRFIRHLSHPLVDRLQSLASCLWQEREKRKPLKAPNSLPRRLAPSRIRACLRP